MQGQSEQKLRYDATCKEVLSEKSMIACILQTCVEEFKGCSIRDIVRHYIQGTPDVGTIVVEPDGGSPLRIRNEQTEDKTQHEGTVFYDIRFTALAPRSDKPIELIINIEAQNDFHPGYPLLKRAIYYCSRMISSQYGQSLRSRITRKSKRSTPSGSVPNRQRNGLTASLATG